MDPQLQNVIVPVVIAALGLGPAILTYFATRSNNNAQALEIYSKIRREEAKDAIERIRQLEKRLDASEETQRNQRDQIATLIEVGQQKDRVIFDMRVELNRLGRQVIELKSRLSKYEPV